MYSELLLQQDAGAEDMAGSYGKHQHLELGPTDQVETEQPFVVDCQGFGQLRSRHKTQRRPCGTSHVNVRHLVSLTEHCVLDATT